MKRGARYVFGIDELLATFSPDTDHSTIADALGVPKNAIAVWKTRGIKLDAFRADRLAIRIGLHPALVWGQQWWDECVIAEENKARSYERKLQKMREYKVATRG